MLYTSLERRFRTLCNIKYNKYDFRVCHKFVEMNEEKETSNERQNKASAQRAGGTVLVVPFYEPIVVVCDVVCCQCPDTDVNQDDEWKIGQIVKANHLYSVSAGVRWYGGKRCRCRRPGHPHFTADSLSVKHFRELSVR